MQLRTIITCTALFLLQTTILQAQLVDIVDTAVKENLLTLDTALKAADLVATLKGNGPFTVFAPNDVAFNKLPNGVFDELAKLVNKPTLSKILLYHVIGQNLTAADIDAMTLPVNLTMLSNSPTVVSKDGTNIKVNDGTVIKGDVFATNGVIHVLDAVLLPPFDIVETAVTNGGFNTLVAAIRAADLEVTLKGTGPFTVFAPTDAAFKKLPSGTLDDLLKPENKEKLAKILKYHVINKRVSSADINQMQLPAKVEMLEGGTVTVKKEGDNIKVNDATVTAADIQNTNGLIHVIDTVLMPASLATSVYLNKIFLPIATSFMLLSLHFLV